MEKTHNGKWDEAKDQIDPILSKDQYYPNYPASGALTFLGLDTEMLVEVDGKIQWPHKVHLPQERKPESTEVGDGTQRFDFHGDGFATELNVAAVHCLEYMMENISRAFSWLSKGGTRKVKIKAPAIYTIPPDIAEKAPEDIKKLGCMPSINVYGDPGDPSSLEETKRTTGCHLHISHPALQTEATALALVKWADVLVGSTWAYISPGRSLVEAERRRAYGRAGEYRLKTYPVFPANQLKSDYRNGVEYRVLPGTVMDHPAYLTLMFSLYRSAMRLAADYGEPQAELSLQAKAAINNSDRKLAKSVIRSLPISPGGRKLIRFMRRNPLKLEDLPAWYNKGYGHQGHRRLFEANSINTLPLTL